MCSHGWFFHTGALKVSSDQYSADVPVWSVGIWTLQQFYRVKNQTVVWLKCRPSVLFNRKDETKELLRIQVLTEKNGYPFFFLIKILNFSVEVSTFITWQLLFQKYSPKSKRIVNCAVVTDYYVPFFIVIVNILCAVFQNVLISKRPKCQKLRQISLGNTIQSGICFFWFCFVSLLQFYNTRVSFSASFE